MNGSLTIRNSNHTQAITSHNNGNTLHSNVNTSLTPTMDALCIQNQNQQNQTRNQKQ